MTHSPFRTEAVPTSRCVTEPDEIRQEQWDLDLRRPSDDGSIEPVSTGRSRAIRIAVLLFLVAAASAAYIAFRLRSQGQTSAPPARAVQATEGEVRPLGGEAAPIALPPLDQSHSVDADPVGHLSSPRQVASLLLTTARI